MSAGRRLAVLGDCLGSPLIDRETPHRASASAEALVLRQVGGSSVLGCLAAAMIDSP